MAVRTARTHIKNDQTHLRYAHTSLRPPSSEQLYVRSLRLVLHEADESLCSSFLSDQVDPTAPLNPTPRPTGRRRTPGPSAPASWFTLSSSRLTLTQKTLTAEETLERRWRMYELWCGEVVEGYVREEQMPNDVQRRRRRRRDAEDFRGARTSRGPPSLVNTTLRLLSHYMDPPATSDRETSWLASADVKRYLGAQVRIAIMVHGVWEGWTTWRGVRDLAAGEEDDDRVGGDAGGENEDDDWDATSSASETTSSPVPNLPIQDFSFCRIDTIRDQRHLSRYLATPAVRSSTEAISFAGTCVSPMQALDVLSSAQGKSGAWIKLKSVSLAGLRGGEEEWKVAFGKLARCASGLEVSSSVIRRTTSSHHGRRISSSLTYPLRNSSRIKTTPGERSLRLFSARMYPGPRAGSISPPSASLDFETATLRR